MAELLILVLGISMSFLLNEWRVNADNRKVEVRMLEQFQENLIKDSTALSGALNGLDVMLEASNRLLDLNAQSAYNDSIAINLVRVLNFSGFYPTDITYQEMRSLGNSRMIKNKELLKELIQLYESDFSLVREWTSADRSFLLNDMLPYFNGHLPFARGLNFPSLSNRKKQQLVNELTTDESKYVIQSGLIMKSGTQVVYRQVLDEVRKILNMLEVQLND